MGLESGVVTVTAMGCGYASDSEWRVLHHPPQSDVAAARPAGAAFVVAVASMSPSFVELLVEEWGWEWEGFLQNWY